MSPGKELVLHGSPPVPGPVAPRRRRPSRRALISAGLAVVAVVAGGLSVALDQGRTTVGRDGATGPSAVTSPAPTGSSGATGCAVAGTGVKQPLSGLLTVAGPPPRTSRVPVGGWSVNVDWADLQPRPGGPITRPNAIDAAIEQVRERGTGCDVGLKLRVLAGTRAPDWAKELGGPPVELELPQEERIGTVPRFWTPEFGAAYAQLQAELAEIYDGVGEVRETVVARCTTFYAEPMLRQAGSAANRAALEDAGFSAQADAACLDDQITAHQVWRRTPSSLALNPYLVDGTGEGGVRADLTLPAELARRCREALATRCILANNSLRSPDPSAAYTQLYEELEELGPPLEFQSAGPLRIGDPHETVRRAIALGAASLEVHPGVLADDPSALADLVTGFPRPVGGSG